MGTTKFSSIKARRIRLTAVDTCGAPIFGLNTSCSIVTGGFVSVTLATQTEDGEDFSKRNAYGDLCINDIDPSLVKGFQASIEFCQVDPELISLLCGGRTFVTGTPPNDTAIGGTFGESVGQDFAMEIWTKVAGGACAGASAYTWIYWVLPHLRGGVIGDLTFEYAAMSFTVESARSLGAGARWGTGLYTDQDLPSALLSTEHIGYVLTTTAPPVDSNGCFDLIAATGATSGTPGTWTPALSIPPQTPADLIAGIPNVVVASPATVWTTGQYVQTQLAGTAGRAYWNGTAWVAGAAP